MKHDCKEVTTSSANSNGNRPVSRPILNIQKKSIWCVKIV